MSIADCRFRDAENSKKGEGRGLAHIKKRKIIKEKSK
jgi:hypothetical protein